MKFPLFRFRSIAKSYFRRADGVLLLYDCTYERSFINIREWMDSIEVNIFYMIYSLGMCFRLSFFTRFLTLFKSLQNNKDIMLWVQRLHNLNFSLSPFCGLSLSVSRCICSGRGYSSVCPCSCTYHVKMVVFIHSKMAYL